MFQYSCIPSSRTLRILASVAVGIFFAPHIGVAQELCNYYEGHANAEGKIGNQRNLAETSVFLPLMCSQETLLFSDVRYKTDNHDNYEGNFALGVRDLQRDGIIGGYIYFDRRKSGLSEKLHSQITFGAEWLAENWETRGNFYVPLTGDKLSSTGIPMGTALSDPFLSGTGIFINQAGSQAIREVPLYGGDIEGGFKIPNSDFWLHLGAYRFDSDHADGMVGARARLSWNVTDNVTLTAEGQDDSRREKQGWIGVRLTVPFGGGAADKPNGIRSRMTLSPVRDVDIVTTGTVEQVTPDTVVPVLNATTGTAQRVIYVDNTAAGGGDGSLETPFNTLADAEAALQTHDTLYIFHGDGTSTGMNAGLSIGLEDVHVIGEGSAFVYDGTRFTTGTGESGNGGSVIRAAGSDPIISNTAGDGVVVSADNIFLTGFTVDGATGDGVVIEADGAAASAQNITVDNIIAQNNRFGIYIHGTNGGAVSAKVENSATLSNSQHGVAVYDDTANTFDVDLGGGALGSSGRNILAGNTLEDLAVDYDGRSLAARNNWWGHATGPDSDDPSDGIRPQIYYGAPINDGLAGHWTFDSEWTNAVTAYDRSSQGNNGSLSFGGSYIQAPGQYREAIHIDGVDTYFLIPDDGSLDISDNLTILIFYDKDATHVGYAQHPIKKWTDTSDANYVLYDFGTTSGGFWPDDYAFYANRGGVWGQVGNRYDSPPANGMEYIGLTYSSGAGGQMYVNGSPYLAILSGGILATNNANLSIGGKYNTIDDVRIYNRVLSSSEIAELYRMDASGAVDVGGYLVASP